jgi:hypothetical protein
MKIRSIFLLPLAMLLCFSCKKDEQVRPGFDMDYRHDFSILPGLGTFVVHHFQLNNIPSRYQTYLSENTKTDTDITRIISTQANLSGVFGDANLDFVEEVKINIYPEADPTDYVEFAYRYPVPLDPGNNLGLISNEQNIKRFLKESRFNVDVIFRMRKTTTEEIPMRLDMKFRAEL